MLNHLLYTGNLSESDEMEKIIQDRWLKIFIRYVVKGDYIILTFWDEFYVPTPNLYALKQFAEKYSVNTFKQNVMKLPASNEVRDIIIEGAFTFKQVLISYFHLEIKTNDGKRIFSSEDNGTVVLLHITEEDRSLLNEKSIAENLIKLETPIV